MNNIKNDLTINAAVNLIDTDIANILKIDKNTEFVTDVIIEDVISEVMKITRYKNLDKDQLFDIVSPNYSSFYEEESKILKSNINHENWLDVINDNGYHRSIKWNFWDDYQRHLIQNSKFSPNVIHGKNGINNTVNKILSVLDDPIREGDWDRRGLVVGEVQSGKTANYIGLCCKAADAGYKLIIILAGMYNDLRAQTQQRVDEGFYGYNSKKGQVHDDEIGVGKYPGHPLSITYTDVKENGDFTIHDANVVPPDLNLGKPIILVIKKNVKMLDALESWLDRVLTRENMSILNTPLLLIDDECDNASVNTKKYSLENFNEEGEHVIDPTKINYGIRNLLRKFKRSAYIGYTATPFANVLIKRNDKHKSLGEDLFPRDFILNIPRPTNHIGPDQFFGISEDDDSNIKSEDGYKLLEIVNDGDQLLPNVKELKTNVVIPSELNPSLLKAIKYFILSCAGRSLRGQKDSHNSMLVHVSHYVNAQKQIHEYVEDEILRLRKILLEAPFDHYIWKQFKAIWINNFIPISKEMELIEHLNVKIHSWSEIKKEVKEELKKVEVVLVNGKSKDSLDYVSKKEDKIFRNFIAVGGNRLARGLTLDSLTISYFLRTSKMYDTLLQMGRWFGYRPGYLDLCRIFTTKGLISAYRNIALATKELKQEFDQMYDNDEKPENWGLKIRSHPKTLMVTGYGKSHWSTKAKITFDAKLLQSHNTIIKKEDCLFNQNIIEKHFLNNYKFIPAKSGIAFLNHEIKSKDIITFIRSYKIGPSVAWKPALLSKYIRKRNEKGDLVDWTVAILSAQSDKRYHIACGLTEQPVKKIGYLDNIKLTNRNGTTTPSNNYVILDKAVLSGSHEWLDWPNGYSTDDKDLLRGNNNFPNSIKIRANRKSSRALLLLYPLYGKKTSNIEHVESFDLYGLDPSYTVFGAVISFPGTKGKVNEVEYVFDELAVQQEFDF
jgi:hypothetical protein